MLELLGAWLLFPLLLATACLGLGLLVERLAGLRIDGVVLLPLGLAALIALAQTVTFADPLAELATPAVVAAAVAGLWLGRARLRPLAPERWAAAGALAVFAAYAAPIVLSGEATFAGYTLLGDTSIHFILSDWVGEHGPHRSDALPGSSYAIALNTYIDTGYPTGTHAALAAVRPFGLQDVAWTYQPFLAFAAAMAALSFHALLAGAIRPRPLRALAAVLAASPGLVYGYYLQGSIKEIVMVALLPLLAALVVCMWRAGSGWRRTIPVAVVAAATLGALNLAAAPYVGPLGLAAVLALALRRRAAPRVRAIEIAVLGVVTAGLSLPTLGSLRSFVDVASTSLTSGEEVGNLLRPLSILQAFGVWPRGDYRLALAEHAGAGYVLIGVVAAAAVFGALFLLRRRYAGPLLLAGAMLVATAFVLRRGSPWADGKALMIASSVVVMTAMLGVESLRRSRRGLEAAVVAGVIVAGIGWTNALAYRWVDLAPRDRLEQLADTGDAIDGQGPVLYPEFEEFAKYFLRDAAPSGSSESWQVDPRGRLQTGGAAPFGFSTELDQLAPDYVRGFRTIVLRRGPAAIRAPGGYRLTMRTADYEVWQRPQRPVPDVLAHLGAGDTFTGRGLPDCAALAPLAERAREAGGALVHVAAPPAFAFQPAQVQLPAGWVVDGNDPFAVRPNGPGTISGGVEVAAAGSYDLWLQGSFGREVSVRIDGRDAGVSSDRLSPRGGFEHVGAVQLPAGTHRVELVSPGQGLGPGEAGGNRLIGPLVLVARRPSPRLVWTRPARWRSLCHERVDWVEAVRDRG